MSDQEPVNQPEAPAYIVDIALPLNVTFFGALGQLMGKAWPGSKMYFGEDVPAGHARMSVPKHEVARWLEAVEEDDEFYA